MASGKIGMPIKDGVIVANSNGYVQIRHTPTYSLIKEYFQINGSFTEIVFYSDGRVTLERWSDDQWKTMTTLRQAD